MIKDGIPLKKYIKYANMTNFILIQLLGMELSS